MPDEQSTHPRKAELKDFLAGKVSPEVVDEIEKHLNTCEPCCQTVQGLGDDTFIEMMRQSQDTPIQIACSKCQARFKVRAAHHGKKMRCRKCGHVIAIQKSKAARASSMDTANTAGPDREIKHTQVPFENEATQQESNDAVTIDPVRRMPESGAATIAPTSDGEAMEDASFEEGVPAALAEHPRYRIVGKLGQGGMGAVYKAEHRLMKRMVALKIIGSEFVANKAAVKRFRREVQTAASLEHPNIVAAYDAEQAGNVHFLVMAYVKGADLAQVLQERGPLPIDEACNYMRQAALGLQHAHENGMVHRDIKPQNLMLTSKRRVKILDFGLASLAEENGDQETGLTARGVIMGTPDYMAPEQAKDAHSADIRADIYSLGCTLYCLLTGHVPFPKGTAIDKIIAHSERDPQPANELREELPPGLAKVLDRMMAKDPADRYETPAEVAEALAPFVDESAVPESAVPESPVLTASTGGGGRGRRWPFIATLAGTAAFMLLAVAGIVLYMRGPDGSTIRIEINDPKIKIGFEGDSYTFNNKGEEIKITPGKNQKLHVEYGELKFWTKEFALGAGENAPLRVHLLPGNLKVTVGGKVVGEQPMMPPVVAQGPGSWKDEITLVRKLKGHANAGAWRNCIAVSSDGQYVLSAGGKDGTLRWWEISSGKELHRFLDGNDHVDSIALSTDGKYVAAAVGWDGEVRIWEATSGKQVQTLQTEKGGRIAFSADGRLLFAVRNATNHLIAWDVATGKNVAQHDCKGYLSSYLPLADNKNVVLAIGDAVRYWNLETNTVTKKFDASRVWSFAMSSDGGTLALGQVGSVEVWDTTTWKQLHRFRVDKDVVSIQFLTGNRHIITGGTDGRIVIWDLQTGRELVHKEGLGHLANCVRLVHGGRQAVSFGSNYQGPAPNPVEGDFDIRIWQLPESVWPKAGPMDEITLVRRLEGHTGPVKALAYSSDGKLIASGSGYKIGDKTARIWDADTGKLLHTLDHSNQVMTLAFSPDNAYLLTGSLDGKVVLWDISTRKDQILASGLPNIDAVAFSPDGRTGYVAAKKNTVLCLNIKTGKQEAVLEGPKATIMQLAVTPDGKYVLAATRDSRVYIWERTQGKPRRIFPEKPGAMSGNVGMALLPGGRVLITDDSKTLRLFDWQKAELVHEAALETSAINIAASPDGRFAYLACPNGQIAVVNLNTWETNYHETGDRATTWDVSLSPDGTRLLSAGGSFWAGRGWQNSGDYAVRLWRLPESVYPKGASAAPVPAKYALQFDEDDHAVALPFSIAEPGVKAVTAEAWVQIDSFPPVTVSTYQNLIFAGWSGFIVGLTNKERSWMCRIQNSEMYTKLPVFLNRVTHVALVIDERQAHFFLDGKLAATQTLASPFTASDAKCLLGNIGQKNAALRGKLLGVRLSKSVRYTKNFTPERRWQTDADTLALYHCDAGSGDVLKDSSGNGRHGQILGAKWVRLSETKHHQGKLPEVVEPKEPAALDKNGWTQLYNGKERTGWQKATWTKRNGEWRTESSL